MPKISRRRCSPTASRSRRMTPSMRGPAAPGRRSPACNPIAGDSNVTVVKPRPRTELVWGVIDQGFSSGTNLALSILAGQLLGPGGLGVIYLAFSMYLLALSFLRAAITEPFMVP